MNFKKTFSFLIIAFVCIINQNSKAQNFQWIRNQSFNILFNPDLTSFNCATDYQGNSILSSIYNYKLTFNLFMGDVSLKKFSPSGIQKFNRIMSGKLNIKGLQTDLNGNIYVSGSFMDTLKIDSLNFISNTGTGYNLNYFMIKLSPLGEIIWKRNINTVYTPTFILDVIKIKNNNLYLGLLNGNSAFIKKYDLNGNEIMSINASDLRGISGIDVDPSGNICSTGSCSSGNINFAGQSVTAPFPYNVYFVKYNSSGAYVWSRFVEDITFQNPDIYCDNSGNIFAAGDLSGSFMFGNIQTQGRQWVYDFFLTKIDASGNFLWVKEVPATATITGDAGLAAVNGLAADLTGNVYISGFLRGTMNWGNNIITSSSGNKDLLILKYDQNGNLLSGKTAGGTGSDRIDCIAADNFGNIFISGNFANTAHFDTITAVGTGFINSFLGKMSAGNVSGLINLSLIIEGFYDVQSDKMRMKDTVSIYLRNSISPYEIIDSSRSVIDSVTHNGLFFISNAFSGSYYLQIRHRNSIETWSAVPVDYIQGSFADYSFTSAASRAFGNNLAQVSNSPVRFGIYNGDVNQDGTADAVDLSLIDNDVINSVSGYFPSDLTGDHTIDAADLGIADNNVLKGVSTVRP
ncbi:MAG: hypothetical protein JST15_08165 [Bacteroidetes bacterium]|nr:hypothetical protein [Bacteroidota bacterium]